MTMPCDHHLFDHVIPICFPFFMQKKTMVKPAIRPSRLGHAGGDGANACVGHQLHRDFGLRTHLATAHCVTTINVNVGL